MKRALIIISVIAAVLVTAGWFASPRIAAARDEREVAQRRLANRLPKEAVHALVSDPRLTLFSIDPSVGTSPPPNSPTFQRWLVLGQTTVTSPEQRQKIAEVIESGLGGWSGRGYVGCFNPRHAIRATDGRQTFDFLICFECGWLYYFPPDAKERHLCIRTKPGALDELLSAAGIPLSQ
jgi:hypothetical protein